VEYLLELQGDQYYDEPAIGGMYRGYIGIDPSKAIFSLTINNNKKNVYKLSK